MSAESVIRPDLVTPLEWDTRFFGVRTAKLVPSTLDAAALRSVLELCEADATEVLFFLCDSRHRESVRLAEGHGFRLMDVRVELERRRDAGEASGADPFSKRADRTVRHFRPDDADALRAMTRGAFADSRFYFDERFPDEACDRMYVSWLDQYLLHDLGTVLVEDAGSGPRGYITLSAGEGPATRIGLTAAAAEHRGKGVGTRLVLAALDWAWESGYERVDVVTHGRSVSAQRLYQRCGFTSKKTGLWYHRWFDP